MFWVNVLYGKVIKLEGIFDYPRPGNQKCLNLIFALGVVGNSITSSSEQEFSLHIRRFLWAKRGERGILREARNECEARGEEFKEALLGVGLTRHGGTDHAKRGKIVICINPKFFRLTSFWARVMQFKKISWKIMKQWHKRSQSHAKLEVVQDEGSITSKNLTSWWTSADTIWLKNRVAM